MITGNGKTKTRGFSLKKHVFLVSKCAAGLAWSPSRDYCHLGTSPTGPCPSSPMSKLLSWCRHVRGKRAGLLRSGKPVRVGGVPVGQDAVEEGPAEAAVVAEVPKGHLAVYVGRRSGEFLRVLVPVVAFNHPLFRDLLREAEEEFGFYRRGGGITIPCEVSEFERVKSRVAAAGYGGRRSTWKKHL